MSSTDMFFGAKPHLFAKAKELRLNMTSSEQKLWRYLSNKKISVKFRRQHPIAEFIADFYCHSIRLVIEVDGGVHSDPEQAKYDVMRTEILEEYGIKVIRFSNEEVEYSIEEVVRKIEDFVTEGLASVLPPASVPPPAPSSGPPARPPAP